LTTLADIGNVAKMQVITIKHVAAAVGKTERRVRQVVAQLSVGTELHERMLVLNSREFSRVKRHFAAISKKRAIVN
jgi:hypothetical protein